MPRSIVSPAAAEDVLAHWPVTYQETASRASQLVRLALLAPAAVAILVPLVLVAAHVDNVAQAVVEHPVASIQLLAGLGIWAVMFVVPTLRLIADFGRRRMVKIEPGRVTVLETSLARNRVREVPLSAFHGIAHLVRTTNAGPRHELVLVHDDPSLRVPIHTADRIAPLTIARAAALLGLPEMPARDVLRLRGTIARDALVSERISPLAA